MMLNVQQVSDKLGVSTYRVKQLIESGQITSTHGGGARKYHKVDDKAVVEYKRSLKPAVAAVQSGQAPAGFMSVADYNRSKNKGPKNTTVYGAIERGEVERFKANGRTFVRDVTSNGHAAPKLDVLPLTGRFQRIEDRLSAIEARVEQIITAFGGL